MAYAVTTLEMEVLVRHYNVVGAFTRREDTLRALVSTWMLTSPLESVDLMVRFFATIARRLWTPSRHVASLVLAWYRSDMTHTVSLYLHDRIVLVSPLAMSFVVDGSQMDLCTMQPNGLSCGDSRDVTFRDLCDHVEPLDDRTMDGLFCLFLNNKIDAVIQFLAFVPIRVQGFEGGVMRTIASFLI